MSALPQHQREFIERVVASGRYADEGQAIAAAVDLLEEREARRSEARQQFRELLAPGLDAIEHGEEVSAEDAFARARAVLAQERDSST
jgi:putative addiction module CopG family antidote